VSQRNDPIRSDLPQSAPPESGFGRGAALLLGAVFLAGSGTMIVELSAVHLMAPWFGSTNAVWTNAIGVILLALSMGYALGAHWSRAPKPSIRLVQVLVVAAIWVSLLPWINGPVAGWFMPQGVTLDSAVSLLFWGSLACSAVLFVPPAWMLGCVAPLAVELLARGDEDQAGHAGGRVLAVSTLGSLVGTFATTYWLIPSLGLRLTFGLAALALALAACLITLPRKRYAPLGLWILVPLLTGLAPDASPSTPDGLNLLAQEQSPYQFLRVVESEVGRRLVVNEAMDSFQSVWRDSPGLIGPGHYYDYFVPPVHWDTQQESWELLTLGLGAGTAVRVLEGELPNGVELLSTGVEIDPHIVRLGVEYFDLDVNDSSRRVLSGMDARAALRLAATDFDQIILDAYANNMEIPTHLCSAEFFEEVRSHLRPGGWFTVNVAGFGLQDVLVDAVAQTVASAFDAEVLLVRVPFSRNCMLYARNEGTPLMPSSAKFLTGSPELQTRLQSLRIPGAWRVVAPPENAPLTDDYNPILALQRRSVEQGFKSLPVKGLGL
jgi:spermidine synthase